MKKRSIFKDIFPLIMSIIFIHSAAHSKVLFEKELNAAKKAFEEKVYDHVDYILSFLTYQREIGTKNLQEGLWLYAYSSFRQGKVNKSEQLLDRLLIADPLMVEPFDVYFLKLEVLLWRKDFYLAEKTMDLIWAYNIPRTKKYSAMELLLKHYLKEERYYLAKKYFSEKVSYEKDKLNKAHLQLMLLEVLLQQGNLKEAGNFLEGVNFDQWNDPYLLEKKDLLLGRMHLGGQEYDLGLRKFLEFYEKTDVSEETKQEAHFGLCLSYWNLGKHEDAKKHLEDYIKTYPLAHNVEEGEVLLAQSYLKLKQYSKAEKMLSELTKKGFQGEDLIKGLYWLGEAYYRQKKYNEAIDNYKLLSKLCGEDKMGEVYAYFGLAWVFYEQEKLTEASQLFKDVANYSFDHPFIQEAWIMEGQCLYHLKKYREAEVVYLNFIEKFRLSKRRSETLYKIGLIQKKLGQNDAAVVTWKRLYKEDPESVYATDALWRIGKTYYSMGNFTQARDWYLVLSGIPTRNNYKEVSLLEAGNCAYNSGQYQGALEIYQRIIEESANSEIKHQAIYYSGWCHYFLNEEGKTQEIFSNFLKNYPSSSLSPQILFWQGEHAYNGNMFAESQTIFEKLAKDYPESDLVDNALYLAAKSAFRIDRMTKAVKLLELLGRTDSDLRGEASFLQGECLFRLGKVDLAIEKWILFETSFSDSYLKKEAFERLGQAFISKHEYNNAYIYLNKANKVFQKTSLKNDLKLLFLMAHCQANLGEEEKALELALKVIYDSPNSKLFLDSIEFATNLYLQKKKFGNAIALQMKLLKEGEGVDKDRLNNRIRKLRFLKNQGENNK